MSKCAPIVRAIPPRLALSNKPPRAPNIMYTLTWIDGQDLNSISTPSADVAHSLWGDLYIGLGYKVRLWHKANGKLRMVR